MKGSESPRSKTQTSFGECDRAERGKKEKRKSRTDCFERNNLIERLPWRNNIIRKARKKNSPAMTWRPGTFTNWPIITTLKIKLTTVLERMRPLLQRHKAEDLFSRGMDAIKSRENCGRHGFFRGSVADESRKKECYREHYGIYARNKSSLIERKIWVLTVEFFPDDADLRATMGHVYKEMGQ